ncbi:MAG: 30S ribosomal protein S13 [Deltaproteobacteria bacterium]|nr:30S ribosomal protein S13 [Deltaproteobacteria bacterium]
MPRIAGVDIPGKKRIEVALTYVYGIGLPRSRDVLEKAGVGLDTRAEKLTDDELAKIRSVIDANHQVEGNLRRLVSMNIKRLMDIGCYRGLRHKKSLPVRGQRTKTNSRTRKGPRKTVAGKKRAPTSK